MKKTITLELDRVRTLKFTLNSLEIIEDLTGESLDKIGQSMNMKTLKALLFAGLVHEDKELTAEQVGDMIEFDDLERVSSALSEALGGLK